MKFLVGNDRLRRKKSLHLTAKNCRVQKDSSRLARPLTRVQTLIKKILVTVSTNDVVKCYKQNKNVTRISDRPPPAKRHFHVNWSADNRS